MNTPEFEERITLPKTVQEWKDRVDYLKSIVRNIFVENNISFEENVTFPNGLHVDFYNKEHTLAVEVYDLVTHNSSKQLLGLPNITLKTPLENWYKAKELGIRLICAYENEILDKNKYFVFRNMIQYQCGIYHRFFARKTYVEIVPALSMKPFYEKNNIQGYRNAKFAFVLKDKITGEFLMLYSIGHAFFGKGLYNCELARGACDINYHDEGIGVQVLGGASKLWKAIMEWGQVHDAEGNPGQINSIVYYTDMRYYDARSIGHLMDGEAMGDIGTVQTIAQTASFQNFWDNIEENPKTHRGKMKNREPARHAMITNGYKNGNILCVPNAGTISHVFIRNGYKLRENTLIK